MQVPKGLQYRNQFIYISHIRYSFKHTDKHAHKRHQSQPKILIILRQLSVLTSMAQSDLPATHLHSGPVSPEYNSPSEW